jgi:hypothetical protein
MSDHDLSSVALPEEGYGAIIKQKQRWQGRSGYVHLPWPFKALSAALIRRSGDASGRGIMLATPTQTVR